MLNGWIYVKHIKNQSLNHLFARLHIFFVLAIFMNQRLQMLMFKNELVINTQ